MEKTGNKSRRIRERTALIIPVRVSGSDGNYAWSEKSSLLDATPFGARIRLPRPTEPGRLLHVVGAIPQSLRCFDHTEDQYRVWSLVRNLKLLEPDAGALVEIGVAFIGKQPPRSFESNPAQRYEIARTSIEAGLWTVKEESSESLAEVSPTEKRKVTRHNIPVEVLIEVFARDGGISASESTVTENISPEGASVFTTLDLLPGRFVKISSQQYPSAMLAVVRDRRTAPDGIGRLHLEFVGSEWPL
jgi:PilZ domain